VRDADGRPASAGTSQDTEDELARLRAENARLANLRSTVEARFWARDRENMQVGRCERVAEVQIA
jgi:hypothetical protein